jgi:hypothetical protein
VTTGFSRVPSGELLGRMRTVFVAYWVVILAGLIGFLVIGLIGLR